MYLAADGQDGNGFQLEKLRHQVVYVRLQKIDINGRGLLSLCELRLGSSFRCSEMMLCMD